MVAFVVYIIFYAVIGEVQVVGLCRIFGCQRVYLFHYRYDAERFAAVAHLYDGSFGVCHVLLQAGAGYLEV